MELALYCPVYGYYEKEGDIIGRRGDYYTSVSVGKLFGQLLACQFSQWLDADSAAPGSGLQLIEAGAHRGDLGFDILKWFETTRPDLFKRVEYWILEPSPVHRKWQQEKLAEFGKRTRWVEDFAALPGSPERDPHRAAYRVIFSNELLDAMPVRRFGWDAARQRWFEWGVSIKNNEFAWVRMAPGQEFGGGEDTAVAYLQRMLASLAKGDQGSLARFSSVLPDGFTMEISPATECWWQSAAGCLGNGKLVALDYGHTIEELLTPERTGGTLRAYHRHHLVEDILALPGEQDITGDVNFTLVERAGEAAGLRTEFFGDQTRYLTDIARRIWEGRCVFGEWSSEYTRQFQTLTHPEHLGGRFRVLVQARGSRGEEAAVHRFQSDWSS